MWEPEALVDLDQLRVRLRGDLAVSRRPPRPSPWLRVAGWALLLAGWTFVGLPFLAIPAIAVLDSFVLPGLTSPPRDMGHLAEWHPPPSFVVSQDGLPPRG